MKSLPVILLCVVVIVATVTEEEVDALSKAFVEIHKECQKTTNSDLEKVATLLNGETINAKAVEPHVWCVQKKLKVQNENGDYNEEGVRKSLIMFKPQESQVDLVIKNCMTRKEGATPEESAVAIVLCTGKYMPLKIPDSVNPF